MTIKGGKEVSWHDGSSCTNIILKKNGLSVESHNFSKPSFNPYLLTNLRRERGGLTCNAQKYEINGNSKS